MAEVGKMTTSGVGTAATVGGGSGLAAYMVTSGMDPMLATGIASAAAWVVGAAAEWARGRQAGGEDNLATTLLAKLG